MHMEGRITPKKQAFLDMRKAGLNVSLFAYERSICGKKVYDGRINNGSNKNCNF